MAYHESRGGGKPACTARAKRHGGTVGEHLLTGRGRVAAVDFLRPRVPLK